LGQLKNSVVHISLAILANIRISRAGSSRFPHHN
jgi:hypothetical protein